VLRPGGIFVARDVATGTPAELRARRALVEALSEDEQTRSAVFRLGGGVAVATIGGDAQ
jgi:predicted O-methyltransferase YrrM